MKVKWILLAGCLALMTLPVMAQEGSAITQGEATAHVYVNVVPNIAVGVQTANVYMGQMGVGTRQAQIIFRVDANVEAVNLAVVASHLYKGDDPDPEGAGYQIPVAGNGILVNPLDANPTAGASEYLAWKTASPVLSGDWFVRETIEQEYESKQAGHFSQDVYVTVEYENKDSELPTGEYSGWVKLVAQIL